MSLTDRQGRMELANKSTSSQAPAAVKNRLARRNSHDAGPSSSSLQSVDQQLQPLRHESRPKKSTLQKSQTRRSSAQTTRDMASNPASSSKSKRGRPQKPSKKKILATQTSEQSSHPLKPINGSDKGRSPGSSPLTDVEQMPDEASLSEESDSPPPTFPTRAIEETTAHFQAIIAERAERMKADGRRPTWPSYASMVEDANGNHTYSEILPPPANIAHQHDAEVANPSISNSVSGSTSSTGPEAGAGQPGDTRQISGSAPENSREGFPQACVQGDVVHVHTSQSVVEKAQDEIPSPPESAAAGGDADAAPSLEPVFRSIQAPATKSLDHEESQMPLGRNRSLALAPVAPVFQPSLAGHDGAVVLETQVQKVADPGVPINRTHSASLTRLWNSFAVEDSYSDEIPAWATSWTDPPESREQDHSVNPMASNGCVRQIDEQPSLSEVATAVHSLATPPDVEHAAPRNSGADREAADFIQTDKRSENMLTEVDGPHESQRSSQQRVCHTASVSTSADARVCLQRPVQPSVPQSGTNAIDSVLIKSEQSEREQLATESSPRVNSESAAGATHFSMAEFSTNGNDVEFNSQRFQHLQAPVTISGAASTQVTPPVVESNMSLPFSLHTDDSDVSSDVASGRRDPVPLEHGPKEARGSQGSVKAEERISAVASSSSASAFSECQERGAIEKTSSIGTSQESGSQSGDKSTKPTPDSINEVQWVVSVQRQTESAQREPMLPNGAVPEDPATEMHAQEDRQGEALPGGAIRMNLESRALSTNAEEHEHEMSVDSASLPAQAASVDRNSDGMAPHVKAQATSALDPDLAPPKSPAKSISDVGTEAEGETQAEPPRPSLDEAASIKDQATRVRHRVTSSSSEQSQEAAEGREVGDSESSDSETPDERSDPKSIRDDKATPSPNLATAPFAGERSARVPDVVPVQSPWPVSTEPSPSRPRRFLDVYVEVTPPPRFAAAHRDTIVNARDPKATGVERPYEPERSTHPFANEAATSWTARSIHPGAEMPRIDRSRALVGESEDDEGHSAPTDEPNESAVTDVGRAPLTPLTARPQRSPNVRSSAQVLQQRGKLVLLPQPLATSPKTAIASTLDLRELANSRAAAKHDRNFVSESAVAVAAAAAAATPTVLHKASLSNVSSGAKAGRPPLVFLRSSVSIAEGLREQAISRQEQSRISEERAAWLAEGQAKEQALESQERGRHEHSKVIGNLRSQRDRRSPSGKTATESAPKPADWLPAAEDAAMESMAARPGSYAVSGNSVEQQSHSRAQAEVVESHTEEEIFAPLDSPPPSPPPRPKSVEAQDAPQATREQDLRPLGKLVDSLLEGKRRGEASMRQNGTATAQERRENGGSVGGATVHSDKIQRTETKSHQQAYQNGKKRLRDDDERRPSHSRATDTSASTSRQLDKYPFAYISNKRKRMSTEDLQKELAAVLARIVD